MTTPPASVRIINLVPAALMTIGALLLINFFSHVASPLMAVVLALLIATALNPVVRTLSRWMPRGLAAAATVLVLTAVLLASVLLTLPPLFAQLSNLAALVPTNVGQLQDILGNLQQRYPQLEPLLNLNSDALRQVENWAGGWLSRSAGSLVSKVTELGLGIFLALVTLVMIIYALANPTPLINGAIGAVPQGYRIKATRALAQILMQMGAWGRATVLLMLLMGGAMAAGLYFLGLENWLIFGLLAAVGELIPDIGSIIATAIPAVFALAVDPKIAVYVVILSIVLHVLEAYVVAPMLMSGAAKMHPLSVMAGILLFGSVFGLVGAFLTVPFLIVIKALYENFYLTDRPNISDDVAQALIRGDVEEELAEERKQQERQDEEQETAKPAARDESGVSLDQLEGLLGDTPEDQAGSAPGAKSSVTLSPAPTDPGTKAPPRR
ncbi:AI-2E family transporter [Deinococcus sp. Marseille-Q6407]|uniref:AI-2E family transporter n=1 Tax=Deinococcus sp. Marseille-Q6407 TaxID=2969223 RepID=UPI0021C16DFA|nr:AI-2E family transporter [Deinococcus sp. Marseille-Q6407]